MDSNGFIKAFGHIPKSPTEVLATDQHNPPLGHPRQDSNEPEPVYYTTEQKKWVINLARFGTNCYGMPIEEAIRLLDNEITSRHISEFAETQLRRIFDTTTFTGFTTPRDTVKKIYSFTQRFEKRFGEHSIPRPSWCARQYDKLWLSAVILGADGRKFLFARPAFEAASGLNRGKIQWFVDSAKRYHFMEEISKGQSFGKSTVFRLCKNENMTAWRSLQPLNASKTINFQQIIEKKFPWLFLGGFYTDDLIYKHDFIDPYKFDWNLLN